MFARSALILAATLAAQPCAAQSYPSRTIELVVPFVAGGTTDSAARMIAQHLSDKWGQTVIVNNRPGGGGTIGSGIVAKAAPDGHTILVHTIAFAISAGFQKLPYDAIKDFTAITEISSIPLMLVVHPSLPVPGRVGFVAGLFFGFAFGIAGLGAAVLGKFADVYGIVTVYHACAFLPVIGLLAVFLPEQPKSAHS